MSWEVFGPQITIELAGQVMDDEYMSFGLSGSDTSSQMLGADVVVAYIDGARGYATDYNITSLAPVSSQLCLFKIGFQSFSFRIAVRASTGPEQGRVSG